MKCKDGRQRPVAYLSKSLNETEELWNSQQGNIGSNLKFGELEISIREHKIQVFF